MKKPKQRRLEKDRLKTMRFLLVILAILYVVSPYDFLPDFFAGLGWIDDLIILYLLWWYFNAYRKKSIRYDSSPKDNDQYFDGGREGRGYESTGAGIPKDPFIVLGISRDSSPEEIRKAYRELVNQYHPDKVAYLGKEFRELAEVRFKEINKAYQELTAKTTPS